MDSCLNHAAAKCVLYFYGGHVAIPRYDYKICVLMHVFCIRPLQDRLAKSGRIGSTC